MNLPPSRLVVSHHTGALCSAENLIPTWMWGGASAFARRCDQSSTSSPGLALGASQSITTSGSRGRIASAICSGVAYLLQATFHDTTRILWPRRLDRGRGGVRDRGPPRLLGGGGRELGTTADSSKGCRTRPAAAGGHPPPSDWRDQAAASQPPPAPPAAVGWRCGRGGDAGVVAAGGGINGGGRPGASGDHTLARPEDWRSAAARRGEGLDAGAPAPTEEPPPVELVLEGLRATLEAGMDGWGGGGRERTEQRLGVGRSAVSVSFLCFAFGAGFRCGPPECRLWAFIETHN